MRGIHHSNILAILRIWSKQQTKHYKISQILQNIDTNSRNDKSLRDFELLKEYAKIMLVYYVNCMKYYVNEPSIIHLIQR